MFGAGELSQSLGLVSYDENQWASSLDYHGQSTEEPLGLLKWLRQKSYTVTKALPERVWTHSANHPENGNMTLEDWLDTYDGHILEHIQHMRENYQAWLHRNR